MVVNGIEYEVQDGEYEGGTDLDKNTFDELQENIDGVFTGQESMGNIVVENIECKNLFDINGENNTAGGTLQITSNQIVLNCSGTWSQTRYKKIKVEQGKTYTLSFKISNPSANNVGIGIYKSDNSTIITSTSTLTSTSYEGHLTFTANDSEIVIALIGNNSSTANTNSVTFSNIQLEKGDTATQFVEHKEFNNQEIINKYLLVGDETNISNFNNLYIKYGKGIHFFNISFTSNCIGAPVGAYQWGMMIIIANAGIGTWFRDMQIYVTDGVNQAADDRGVYIRFGQENWFKVSGIQVQANK